MGYNIHNIESFNNNTDSGTILQNVILARNAYSESEPVDSINSGYKLDNLELNGNVTYVVDGDTLDINGITVRLSLVNTPEKGQAGFQQAKDYVIQLCLGKTGELDVDDGQRRGDKFGRELGVVFCDGINLNEKLVMNKLAGILTEYCDVS
jgi:endonuclease YncB( thermonuclease family)